MVGIAYDDVSKWVGNYPVKVFISQMERIADGFYQGLSQLKQKISALTLGEKEQKALIRECNVAATIAIHCRSVANQSNFITLRDNLPLTKDHQEFQKMIIELENLLRDEIVLAKRMLSLQSSDSRLGYEASNHYFYTPCDLIEKVLNCRDLLDRWLTQQRFGGLPAKN
jgi:hypothetical protein